ncbi:hypothetical protein HPB49_002737 [Dermacentor silvarum]|uniref:Uncharacterized protein n=1 Tax=Dermacentor silvarum TaxID=543639 RepID=A0ACB8CD78_DERSI|nr:hypothetical protein HPB49_002737 [Dermacentor silvarum]
MLKHQHKSQLTLSRKKLWLSDFRNIDTAVLIWFKDVRTQSVPMPSSMPQEKARQFAAILEVTSFEVF